MKSTKINLVIILIFTISLTIITSCNKENVEASIEEEIYNPVFPKSIDIEIENILTFQELADTVEYYNGEEGFYNLVITEPVQVLSENADKIAENSEIIFDTENNTIFNDILTNIEELKNAKEEQLKIDIVFDGNYTIIASSELHLTFNNEREINGEVSEIIFIAETEFTANEILYLCDFVYLYDRGIALYKQDENTAISFDFAENISAQIMSNFINQEGTGNIAVPANETTGVWLAGDTIPDNIDNLYFPEMTQELYIDAHNAVRATNIHPNMSNALKKGLALDLKFLIKIQYNQPNLFNIPGNSVTWDYIDSLANLDIKIVE